jgi:hypothetical protein
VFALVLVGESLVVLKMDSPSPKRSGLRFFKLKIILRKGKNKFSSKEHDAKGHAANPGAPGDDIPDGTPKDRGDTSTGHSLVMTEDLSRWVLRSLSPIASGLLIIGS